MVGTGVLDQRIKRLAQSLTAESESREMNVVLHKWNHGKIDFISAYRSLESLKNRGVVYGWGLDGFGELMRQDEHDWVFVQVFPQELTKFGIVTKVLAGYFTSFVLKGEKLFASGENDLGHLGHGGLNSFKGVQSVKQVKLQSVRSFESKCHSTFAIDTSSRLWSWGCNDYGQLGRPTDKIYDSTPRIIDSLRKYKIKQVASSSEHVCCLTVDGEVLTWLNDRDDYANYAHYKVTYMDASVTDIKLPTKINTERILQIACGEYHTLLLSVDQKTVWAFGCNNYGQLGHDPGLRPKFDYCLTPLEVPLVSDKKIVKLQCGEFSSAVLSADGRITVWGHTAEIYDYKNGHLPRVINIEQKVADISMSEASFFLLALTIDNRLYAVGNNRSGQCGQGQDAKDFYEQPVRVKNLETLRIKQISAGSRHCLIICTKDSNSHMNFYITI